ncbi:MAG: 2-C-methyl-D-erythritol 4-phosphate cytidylyltransferase [Candidatus Omnitrophica bacterium]|nr:2-C-methyl-D-erythritol 4-phosphate cytidylyltransferase [Candidatus Omnitrophota bacterium]
MRPKVVAIVPAAGSGNRLGLRESKPFVLLGGKPIIIYALETLNSSEYIDTIIVAVQPRLIGRLKKIIKKYGISKARFVTAGGKTRSESVRNCFNLVDEDCSLVLIHDAARPFLSKDLIKGTVLCSNKYGACITAIRQTDTVKLADKKLFIRKTLDRNNLWRAQTPQVFRYGLLKQCLKYKGGNKEITDEASCLEYMGRKVKILEGTAKNIKITTREDLKIAEVLL